MISHARIFATIVALSVFTPIVGATPHKVVAVNSVDALYNAVNHPGNHDAEIRIAGGRTYLLSTLRQLPNGKSVARPNEGRLVLQRGMTLVGENTYLLVSGRPEPRDVSGEVFADPASETILDGSGLLGGAMTVAGSAGIVRIGRDNAVRRLTIRSNEEANAAIVVDQLDRHGMNAEVTDCTLEAGSAGGRRGVTIDQTGADFADTSSTVTLERNVIRHHRRNPGTGVQAVTKFTSGLRVSVHLNNNVVYDNNRALLVTNRGSHGTTAEVVSRNNVYRSNYWGLVVWPANDFEDIGSTANLAMLASTDDRITNHGGSGVEAYAAVRFSPEATGNSGNQVLLTMVGTQFIGATDPQNGWDYGLRFDLDLEGAVDFSGSGQVAGVNNRVQVLLTGLAASPIPGESVYAWFSDSDIPEPTNQVSFVGGIGALAGNNPAVPVIATMIVY